MTTIKINTPKYLNFEELFGSMKNARQNQIKFLIHQINFYTIKEGHLGLYHKAYFQFLGITSKELTILLSILDDMKIIQRLTRGTNETGKVSKYKMLQTYSIAESYTTSFISGEKGTPKFIEKFIADDCKVKTTKESKFMNAIPKAKQPTKVSLLQQKVIEQQEIIEALQLELAALRASIQKDDISVQNFIDAVVEPDLTGDHEPLVHDDIHTFKKDEETFVVNCWGELVSNSEFNSEEIEEELADAKSYEKFELSGKEIIKRYDINEHIYTVSIFTPPGLVH